jgi:hypothetical protein
LDFIGFVGDLRGFEIHSGVLRGVEEFLVVMKGFKINLPILDVEKFSKEFGEF